MQVKEHIEQHLKVLCEEIGARPTGSEPNLAAVEYACKEFEKQGLQVQRQSFPCMDWTSGACSLAVDGKELPVRPAPYSLACDVQGKAICLHSLEDLRRAQIGGKIVLLCDVLASEPLMPKSFVFWNPDEHKEIISLLETGKPLAVLTTSLSPESFIPAIEDGDFEIPCGMVLPDSIGAFYDGADAVLKINAQRTPAAASNVIASYGKGIKKVCFSAHIDTKEGTPGALDNASGVAVLLALAAELAGRKFPCQIEFVLFNGEDYYSNPGETAYLASQLSKPGEFVCAYNLDGVGVKNQKLSYSFYECPEKLACTIGGLAARYSALEKIEPWPQGDHMLFASSGVPAIAITSYGIFGLVESVLHTPDDTLEMVDAEKLEMLVSFLLCSIPAITRPGS